MGRPKGSLNDKPWKDAIRLAVSRRTEDGGKTLNLLAESLVKSALSGDVLAMREIGDRLDGKAVQQINANITDERMVVHAPPPERTAEDWSSEHGPVH